jgi:ELWxxDGT repeat protein
LVITDGTSAGTNVLDINVGPDSSSPEIIGQANGLLYFVATATAPTTGVATKSIFSTNGTTFIRLTDISSSAILLGLSADKAYFKSSDVARGTELWVADLAASGGGGFRLVKDILVGSGSALAEDNNINPMLVGAKLIFNAYTSATRQALFVSDGTSVGTVQLSNSLPLQSKVVGNTLVFATADGVFGVNVASAVSNALQLLSTANTGVINGTPTFSPTSSSMQTDTDQIFFKTNNGDLYSTKGNISGTIKLAGSVENFKVVGENALFFVQKSATSNATLWYSDGTIAGTRFVEALPINFSYDMDNAVAIRTIGAIVP